VVAERFRYGESGPKYVLGIGTLIPNVIGCAICIGLILLGALGPEEKKPADASGYVILSFGLLFLVYWTISCFWRFADVLVDENGIRRMRCGKVIKAARWGDVKRIRIVAVERKQKFRTPPKPKDFAHGTVDEVLDAWVPLKEPCMGCFIETSDVKGRWRRNGPIQVEERLVGWDDFRTLLNAEVRKHRIPILDCRVKGVETPVASV